MNFQLITGRSHLGSAHFKLPVLELYKVTTILHFTYSVRMQGQYDALLDIWSKMLQVETKLFDVSLLTIDAAGDAESITSIKSESGESGKEEICARKQNDGITSNEVGDDTAEMKDKESTEDIVRHDSSEAASSESGVQPPDEKTKGLKRLSKKRPAAGSKAQQAAKKSRTVSITAEADVDTKDSEETKPTRGRPRKYTSAKKSNT